MAEYEKHQAEVLTNLAQHTKLMKAEYGKQLGANIMAQYELHGKLGAKKKTPANQFRYDGSDSDRAGFDDPDCSEVEELASRRPSLAHAFFAWCVHTHRYSAPKSC